MGNATTVQDADADWVFVAPIRNLYLSRAVSGEFRIQRVLFVDIAKFPRIRRRLKIKNRISEWEGASKEVLKGASAVAIVRHRGKLRESKTLCLDLVREELTILASSRLLHASRACAAPLAIVGEHPCGQARHLILNTRDSVRHVGSAPTRDPRPLLLDRTWKNNQDTFFFMKLVRILQNRVRVCRDWQDPLRRAAIIVGKSVNTTDMASAFLWNMISLEMLLTNQEDKVLSEIPKRVEAFLGWAGFWDRRDFKNRFEKAYKARCGLVHDGNLALVTEELVAFTDELLVSVLTNLVHHSDRFYSKRQVIEFADKVQAEQLLGVKSRVRPKRLIAVVPTHVRQAHTRSR